MAETQTTTYYTLHEIATLRGWAEQKLRRFVRTSELGPMLPTNGKKGKGRAFSDTAVEMLAKHAAEFAPGRSPAKPKTATKPKAAKKAKTPKKRKVNAKKVRTALGQPAPALTTAATTSDFNPPLRVDGLKQRVGLLEERLSSLSTALVGIEDRLGMVVAEIG